MGPLLQEELAMHPRCGVAAQHLRQRASAKGDHQHLASQVGFRFAQDDVRDWSIRGVGRSCLWCLLPVKAWLSDHAVTPQTRSTLDCDAWIVRTSIGRHPSLRILPLWSKIFAKLLSTSKSGRYCSLALFSSKASLRLALPSEARNLSNSSGRLPIADCEAILLVLVLRAHNPNQVHPAHQAHILASHGLPQQEPPGG